MEEIEALVVINTLSFLGRCRPLDRLRHTGSAKEALFELPRTMWEPLQEWRTDLSEIERHGVSLIGILDPAYPKELLSLRDPPLLLYIKGSLHTGDGRGIAIVGTRRASAYGLSMAERIACDVAQNGIPVISGLALGIDTAAHRGALQTGRTVALIGSGHAHLYPKENAELAEQIALRGAVISELPMQTPPKPYFFPRRNRLIAALSLGALLVEGAIKSGGMITLNIARSLGKSCFALPGRADMESFRGNHALIKQGKATLVENAQEMVCKLELKIIHTPDLLNPLPQEKSLLDLLCNEELSLDALCAQTALPIAELSAQILELCLQGKVREYPGKVYKKVTL